jgi:tetratricopeptide (TPR) repeat protein
VQDYGQARDIFARLADEHPDVSVYRRDLAESHSGLGSLLQDLSKSPESEAEYRVALREQQRLVDEHPNVPDYRVRLARSHEGLGNALSRSQGKHMEGVAEYRAAIRHCQSLIEEYPDVPLYRFQLAMSRHHMADAFVNQAKWAEGESEYRAAVQEHQRVADEHPDLPENRFWLALTRHALANALCYPNELRKPAEAEAEYRAAIREHQRVADEHPNVPDYRLWLARCHYRLGTLLANLGKPAEAEAEYRIALKEQRPLEQLRSHADVPAYRGFLSTHHSTLGDALWQKRDTDGAIREYQAAIELNPSIERNPSWPLVLSRGTALERLGQWEAAVSAYSLLLDRGVKNVEARTRRGHAYAVLSQWDKAAADLGPRIESAEPSDFWVQVACLRLLLRDVPAYQQLCRRLPQREDAAKNPHAYNASRIGTLSAQAPFAASQVVRWAEQAVAVEKSAWRLHMLARAHYRAGQFDQAVRRCRESLDVEPGWPGRILNWLVLALAHQRLGHADEARQWLAKACQWHGGLARRKDQTAAIRPRGLHVNDWLEFHVLLPEAQALVQRGAENK